MRYWLSNSGIAFRQDLRRREDDTVRGGIGRVGDRGLRRSGHAGQELNAHQQRKVLVHRIVAVVDIGSTVFAELNLELDRPSARGTQSPDVLSDQPFGRRDGIAPAVDGD